MNSSLPSAAAVQANRSFSTQPIAIAGHRSAGNARDLSLSRSYDSKYASLRRHDDDHLLSDYQMEDGTTSGHVVEITEENISLYATTTANARSGDMVAPVLHVRRGSDPSTTNADNSCRPPMIIFNGNGHSVNDHYHHHQRNAHYLNDLTNDQQSVKRWSTAAATTTTTLSSRLFPPKSSMVSCYLHPLAYFFLLSLLRLLLYFIAITATHAQSHLLIMPATVLQLCSVACTATCSQSHLIVCLLHYHCC